jgi:7-cyano-7-deazaguanine synthase in queuosine biosynthesis
MTKSIVVCDEAPYQASFSDQVLELRHAGSRANVNLSIETPSHSLKAPVQPTSTDLLRIASYCYAADQMLTRGGPADVNGRSWEREIIMYVPVSQPALWRDAEGALRAALNFVSGDRWSFEFSPALPALEQVAFTVDPNQDMGNPDVLCLLSGGLDSLCAAVEALGRGRRPVLVGHEPAPHIKRRRDDIVHALRNKYPSWQFPDISAAIHRVGKGDPPETTHRSRSFLYASLGAIFAERLQIGEVLLADNGVVSLNLPINAQLAGTLASRSTHPRFIRLFNELLAALFSDPPVVRNPFWSHTRKETLGILKSAGVSDLVRLTNSCTRSHGLRKEQDHCGTCSQCVDRRFAVVAADLADQDPSTRYMVDCFRGPLDEDLAKTTVVSYHELAVKISELDGDGLLQEYDQLIDAIPINDPAQRSVGQELIDMLHRHAEATIGVVKRMVQEASEDLARRRLPPNCLLTMLGSRYLERRPSIVFRHTESYQSVQHGHVNYSFSPAQACVVKFLDAARRNGPPARKNKEICDFLQLQGFGTTRVRDLFENHPAWGQLIQNPVRGVYQLPPDLPL